ncbi:MAG: hypothetical protein IJS61_00435 [Firmicutes bacterium]|nr:hypothetical protein [Bacillota bacterium]
MIKKIKEDFYSISKKVNGDILFELCPVYLLLNHTEDSGFLQSTLNEFRLELEEKNIIPSNSSAFICFSAEYIKGENQLLLLNGSGEHKKGLGQWLDFVRGRYHYEYGVIMLVIQDYKNIKHDILWWERLFCDIRRCKKNFMVFISCSNNEDSEIQNLLENEVFTLCYDVENLTVEEYFLWVTERLREYSVSLEDKQKVWLKNFLVRYRAYINFHILDLWLKSSLWYYYGSNNGVNFNPVSLMSENLFMNIIGNRKRQRNVTNIGFSVNKNEKSFPQGDI